MQLSRSFFGLALFILGLASAGNATPLTAPDGNKYAAIRADEPAAHTDAKLTFVGAPINPLAPRDGAAAQSTRFTICGGERDGDYCTGICVVSYGQPNQCIDVGQYAVCSVSATNDVKLCPKTGCNGNCTQLSDCETLLPNGSCYAPGTQSVLVLE